MSSRSLDPPLSPSCLRRLQYKSDHSDEYRIIKPNLHLDNPSPNIVGTALLVLCACLQRNGTRGTPGTNDRFPPLAGVN